jgi:hypothetical protein
MIALLVYQSFTTSVTRNSYLILVEVQAWPPFTTHSITIHSLIYVVRAPVHRRCLLRPVLQNHQFLRKNLAL